MTWSLNIGGCASNAAVDLAKLGVRAASAAGSATTSSAGSLPRRWATHGVDVRGLTIDPTRATSQTLIVNVRGEDRRFIHSFGANQGLSVADLDRGPRPSRRGSCTSAAT